LSVLLPISNILIDLINHCDISSKERPAIIGFRERVFTERQGTVARFQAYSEWSFVTIMQRVLGLLGLRMHYGHPDFFDGTSNLL
jgi:1,3-beta-glucan synthase